MVLAPFIIVAAMATIFSFLLAPFYDEVYPSLKYITGSYPYALACHLIGTQPTSSSKPYRHTKPKTVIKSNAPTMSDKVFGDQEPAWKPVETSQGEDDDEDEFWFPEQETDATLDAWQDSNVFHRPNAALNYEPEKVVELNLNAQGKNSESLRRICEVLMLSGIEYSACKSLEHPLVVDQNTTSTPWSEADQNGIRWKEVKDGTDKGCLYFIKADSIPLKLSATPNDDGSTNLSYYTKNTIGKFCPDENNPGEAEEFYKTLISEIQPSKLTIFLDTKVFGEFTVYDLFEFQMLMDACLIALYQSISQRNPPTKKTLAAFFILYAFAYGLYYIFVK